ncbi:COG2958 family protein [Helicobacter pylori]|uniref:COG2958 family protein n=1 Tax=Helicobacter pylori TaxID=210 RepID=UPI002712014D|nr:COG2958 family protein [Helicobacter pylori]MDO7814747.1 COG2958 family protein [Helicobacter pylori]MDO7819193.1 COG2958 family protein [Helicobacter pylori]MDO7828444.1 COG2958 family protein [Helicobacter pylori]MDO7865972.1 COG2958 family protein [Helicobacter pylori]WQU16916.1 COG2958 family protein [Helicobacter pylori]
MKPQDIEIIQSVLEITGSIKVTEIYDKAKELFEKGEITNMFDCGGKTPHQSVSAFIYTALNKGEELPFLKTQEKPVLIALKSVAKEPVLNMEKISAPSAKIAHNKIMHERDLHPFLTYMAFYNENLKCYTKTIFHEESSKSPKGMDRWLYPDMVGVRFLHAELSNENLIAFSKKFDTLPIKLVSFELKKEISVHNCRECYFQAISNSSWANEGYLVGRHIDTHNPQLMDLLKRLHASFGIGVIDLRTDEDKSAILLNAKYKEKIDYTVASELSAKNEKFSGFLKSVVDYDPNHQHRYKDEFDEVKKKEELYLNPSLSF